MVLPAMTLIKYQLTSLFKNSGEEYLISGNQRNQIFYTDRDFSIVYSFPLVGDEYATIYSSNIENSC